MNKRNENRPGYKKTKVGWIPEEWKYSALKDASLKITDGEHQTPKRANKGIYLLSARNIRDGFLDLTNVDYVSLEEFIKLSKRINPKSGDVLISCSGSIGRCALVDKDIQFSMVRSVALVRPNSKIINSKYLLYILSSKNLQWQILLSINQMAQGNLFQGNIKRLLIGYPKLAEQQKIAEILSAWDRTIEQTEKLIEAKQRLKKGLMQQLLTGRIRFPRFGKPIKKKGELPGGWRKISFSKMYKRLNFKSFQIQKKDYNTFGKHPIIDQGKGDIVGWSNLQPIKEPLPLIIFGDHTREIKWIDRPFVLGADGTIALTVRDNILTRFGYYVLLDLQMPSLGYSRHFSIMKESIFIIPIAFEQEFITYLLDACDKQINFLQKKESILQTQKKGLMQKLLTGEVRVKT